VHSLVSSVTVKFACNNSSLHRKQACFPLRMAAHLIKEWSWKSFFHSFSPLNEWKHPVTVCLKRCLYRIQAYRSWNIAFCPNGFGKLTFTQKLFQCEVHVPRKAFISHVNNQVWTFLRTSLVDIFYPVKYCFVVVVVFCLGKSSQSWSTHSKV